MEKIQPAINCIKKLIVIPTTIGGKISANSTKEFRNTSLGFWNIIISIF